MVQVLRSNPKPKGFAESILGGLGQSIQPAVERFQNQRQLKENERSLSEQMEQENQAAEKMGLNLRGFTDPKLREKILSEGLKGTQEQNKHENDLESETKNYQAVQNYFGDEFANLWKASQPGARTELVKYGLDALARGDNLEDVLKSVETPQTKEKKSNIFDTEENEKNIQVKNGKIPSSFEWPDVSKRPSGYTPKDWAQERKTWRKENAPIFEANKTKVQSNARDALGIKKLNKLNDSRKVGEGFERTLINPETNQFYGVAQLGSLVSEEGQEWVKEIARFQNRAKDAFGSRVTNFDLESYMKQFPGLLNTYEGRKNILKMMDINNKLDDIYDKTLNQIYHKYGLSGISQEDADELATSMIKDETERLRHEYLGIDSENQSSFSNDSKQGLSGRMIDVMGPDGQMYEIDESEVDQLPEGFKLQ